MTVSQIYLVFDELDSFEEYCPESFWHIQIIYFIEYFLALWHKKMFLVHFVTSLEFAISSKSPIPFNRDGI